MQRLSLCRLVFLLVGLLCFVDVAIGQVPASWYCPVAYYNTSDGCDCECGAWDPDCDISGATVYGCDFGEPCALPGVCAVPAPPTAPPAWTCSTSFYGTDDGCDCECGAVDPDCATSPLVYGCPDGQACSSVGVCQLLSAPVCSGGLAWTDCMISHTPACDITDIILDGIVSYLQNYYPYTSSFTTVDARVTLISDLPPTTACLNPADYISGVCYPYTLAVAEAGTTAYCEDFTVPLCYYLPVPLLTVCELDNSLTTTTCYSESLYSMAGPTLSLYQPSFFYFVRKNIPVTSSPTAQDLLNMNIEVSLYFDFLETVDASNIGSTYFFDGFIILKRYVEEDTNFYLQFAFESSTTYWYGIYLQDLGCPLVFKYADFIMSPSSYDSIIESNQGDIFFWFSNAQISSTSIYIYPTINYRASVSAPVGFRAINSQMSLSGSTVELSGYFQASATTYNIFNTVFYVYGDYANVLIQVGSSVLFDNSPVFIYGGVFEFYQSTGLIRDGRVTIFFDSDASFIYFGLLSSTVEIRNSLFEVFGGSVYVIENSTLSLYEVDTEITIDFEVTDTSTLRIVSSPVAISEAQSSRSNLKISDYATCDIDGGTVTLSGNLSVTNSAVFKANNNTFSVLDQGNFMAGSLSVSLSASNFLISGMVDFFSSTLVTMTGYSVFTVGGNVFVRDTVAFSATNLRLQISSSGSMYLQDKSTTSLLSSTVILDGGVFQTLGNSGFGITNSKLQILGSFIASNLAINQFISTSVLVSAGSVFLNDYSINKFSANSIVVISSGNFLQNSQSSFICSDSTLNITGGSLTLKSSSNFTANAANVTIDGGNFVASEQCTVTMDKKTIFLITKGQAKFQGQSTTTIKGESKVMVQGGSVSVFETGVLSIGSTSTLSLTSGYVELFNSSILYLDSSYLLVNGGKLFVNDTSELWLSSGSSIDVEDGLVAFSGYATMGFNNSTVTVTEIESNVFNDLFRVNQNRRVKFTNSSNLNIEGGNLAVSGNASLSLETNSNAKIMEGLFYATDISTIGIFSESLLQIFAGNMNLDSSSRTYLMNGNIQIIDGDLNFDGSASLAAESQSTVKVKGGRLNFRSDSIYWGKSSQIDISGGSVLLFDDSQIIFEEETTDKKLRKRATTPDLTISNGSLVLSNSSSVVSTDASIEIAGGEINANGNSFISAQKTDIKISSGSFNIDDASTVVLGDSNVRINGGQLNVKSSSFLYADDSSKFEINGGSLLVSNQGEVHIRDNSYFSVLQGDVIVSDDAKVMINASTGLIEGGDLEVKNNGYLSLVKNSHVNIRKGELKIRHQAKVILADESYIQNGDRITGGGNYQLPKSSAYEVTAEGTHEITEPIEILPPDGDRGGIVTNRGTWRHSLASSSETSHSIHVRFQQQGNAYFSDGAVSFSDYHQTAGSTTLESATITSSSKPVNIAGGSMNGFGSIQGDVSNAGEIGHGEKGTLINIKGDYKQTGQYTVYISSKEPGSGFTQINVDGLANIDDKKSVISICVAGDFDKGTKFDVLSFKKLLGKFESKNIRFECPKDETKRRTKRDIEDIEACPPSLQYGASTIAVLIGGCINGDSSISRATYSILVGSFLAGTLLLMIIIAALTIYSRTFRLLIYGSDKREVSRQLHALENHNKVSQLQNSSISGGH